MFWVLSLYRVHGFYILWISRIYDRSGFLTKKLNVWRDLGRGFCRRWSFSSAVAVVILLLCLLPCLKIAGWCPLILGRGSIISPPVWGALGPWIFTPNSLCSKGDRASTGNRRVSQQKTSHLWKVVTSKHIFDSFLLNFNHTWALVSFSLCSQWVLDVFGQG
jgi:hypothetical protein